MEELRDLKVTEVITSRGRVKIEVDGFCYHLNKYITGKFYWLCELNRSIYKCNARVVTEKENDRHVLRTVNRYHSHLRIPADGIKTSRHKRNKEGVQLKRLVEYLKLNPEVAKRTCPKTLKRKKFKDFSIELNALGSPQRKWNEWFKVWTQWKKELLKKSVCPPGKADVQLTEVEQTVIQLISDELFYEEESDLNSESDDEVEIIDVVDIVEKSLDLSALATSSKTVQPENSDTLALHEIKTEDEDEVEQNIQRYDSSESLEECVLEFLNMKDELQTIRNCHQKILQDQISVEKDFHCKVLNFMGEIKTSMENIETHLKMNLERNNDLIALKKEKVEAYRQAKEEKLADKQAKLQLQFQLLDSKKRKLDNLMVKKES